MASNVITVLNDEEEETLQEGFDTEEWKTKLKCPICFNYPYGTIYGCRNGHHFCNDCRAKITRCPLCRDKVINCRQLMVETVLRKALKNTLSVCQHDGCNTRCAFDQWMDHQIRCPFRLIRCPKSSLNMCQFRGNLGKFVEHCLSDNCCELNIHDEWDAQGPEGQFEEVSTFQGTVDYHHVDPPLFRRILPTSSFIYKPAVFISNKIATVGLASLIMIRTPAKYWRLVPQILAPDELAKYWTVHLTITDLKRPDAHKYSYWGPPIGNDLPQSHIHNTKYCLTMHEQQLKGLNSQSARCLFEYRITFTINQSYLEKCTPWAVDIRELQKQIHTTRITVNTEEPHAEEEDSDDGSMPELEGMDGVDETDYRNVAFVI